MSQKFETSGIGVTITGETDINGDLNVSGVSTLTGNVSFGSSALFGDGDTISWVMVMTYKYFIVA